jgi:hypothetical protein
MNQMQRLLLSKDRRVDREASVLCIIRMSLAEKDAVPDCILFRKRVSWSLNIEMHRTSSHI